MKIVSSNICSAFEERTIGTKVTRAQDFLAEVERVVATHDFTTDRVPGQALLQVPGAVPFVSAGVGQRTSNPSDYVLREHRGRVGAYLKRSLASSVRSCAVVLYTRRAYFQDPDIDPAEAARIDAADPTHVLVAVLASTGDSTSPLPPYRFVWNLAGGNREAALWSADEIRAKAKEIITYDQGWAGVADE